MTTFDQFCNRASVYGEISYKWLISSRLSILSWDTVGDSNAGVSPEFLQQQQTHSQVR